ncbi:hypothetical protein BS47DRAFT_1482889 [Hydnum rufescens UP504]|uniref:Asteroid domain-containing protein n=1 Tax=Hydnum rufescens UP504 TaxID=1448309 RepID=A0A9P6B7Z2_9AGAM|nr:hypothetical protein BS47DRAFT_1482889 [Hydnum rufescens UP504]
MGVQKLSAFVKDQRKALCEPRVFSLGSQARPETLVVDGWSFLYNLQIHSGLDWVYGGECDTLSELIKSNVRAWIKVGLEPIFIFDGPYSELKIPVIAKRIQQSRIDTANIFFRTSSAARSTPGFLAGVWILSPLALPTCVAALKEEGIPCHYADGEGDPECVAFAVRYNGYILGNDSDYLIFNAQFKGYIPIDELCWNESIIAELGYDDCEDDGFQTVRSSKRSKALRSNAGKALIPPKSFESLTVSIYQPEKLAKLLQIGPGLLPLLASLLGNDFTPPNLSATFFPRSMSGVERVQRAASVIHEVFHPTKRTRRRNRSLLAAAGTDVPGRVTALILATVSDLALRELSLAEQENIADSIRESIFQYLVPDDTSPGGPFTSLLPANEEQEKVRHHYAHLYRTCDLPSNIVGCYTTGTMWPLIFLEDPDVKSAPYIVGGPIREWLYAVLADGLDGVGQEEEEPVKIEMEDEDELIDVTEEFSDAGEEYTNSEDMFEYVNIGASEISTAGSHSQAHSQGGQEYPTDPLTILRNQLESLRVHEQGYQHHLPAPNATMMVPPDESLMSSALLRPSGPRFVTEYIRRGQRLAGVPVLVRSLSTLLEESTAVSSSFATTPLLLSEVPVIDRIPGAPIQLQPFSTRLSLYLHALSSNTERIRRLPSSWTLLAASLRWTIIASSTRGSNTPVKSNGTRMNTVGAKWTPSEARAFLRACAVPKQSKGHDENKNKTDGSSVANGTHGGPSSTPFGKAVRSQELSTRSIQLTASVLAALDASLSLSGALLLGLPSTTDSFPFSSLSANHPQYPTDDNDEEDVALSHARERVLDPSVVRRFSGSRFHTLLAHSHLSSNNTLTRDGSVVRSGSKDEEAEEESEEEELEDVWNAVSEDLFEANHWAEEAWERARSRKEEKRREKAASAAAAAALTASKAGKAGGGKGGKTGLLAGQSKLPQSKFDLLALLGDD